MEHLIVNDTTMNTLVKHITVEKGIYFNDNEIEEMGKKGRGSRRCCRFIEISGVTLSY
ncbi:unnamed protein product [Gongylonema pulchrum]|uniref:Uncharacterized protein n=1 Tax=Gongylonema pulchrum TaxID=637853 RepID=A0A183EAR8_9BILA|nr:unnamed protein product [Gongylonema pulchrum]